MTEQPSYAMLDGMDYTVLARRFRPQSFAEVVGQEHIAQALTNAINSGRVAHAYLFTGARGVGKTSTARILAKALNCPNAKDGVPCNDCEICRSISAGSDVDVLEIDGASNRGIDEIRSLRANVNVKPMRCAYKIYIIDEVHMLTREAFNALLKTLEEPPANVKFIFCTTEPQKVPDTILSRCQRFDFGTIATASIKDRLNEIAAAEGVLVDSEAVDLVARRAAGSMRDSQSLFDQLLAFGGKTIGAADVHRLLGTAPDSRLLELGESLISRDCPRTLDRLQGALGEGAQLSELTDQLLLYFRDLMVLAAGAGEATLISTSDERRGQLAEQARRYGLPSALAALQVLAETKARMKGVTYGRVLAELALVRIASLDNLEGLAEAIENLKRGGSGSPAGAPPKSARSSPALASPPAQKKTELSGDSAEPPARNSSNQGVEPVSELPFEVGCEPQIWAQVISLLTDMTKAHARNVAATAISGPNLLVLTFPRSYHLSKLYFERSPDQLSRIEEALKRVVGRPIRIGLAVEAAENKEAAAAAEAQPLQGGTPRGLASGIDNDVLVQKALMAFAATVVRIDPVEEKAQE